VAVNPASIVLISTAKPQPPVAPKNATVGFELGKEDMTNSPGYSKRYDGFSKS